MIGIGYDIHQLETGQKLILGGIQIKSDFGTVAHSDGDVLIHSIIDALLGAASLGDIGEHFPDNDLKYKDVNSCELLQIVNNMILTKNLKIVNIDATIILEKPKLSDFKLKMRTNLAEILNIYIEQINIKATTNEKLDSIGSKNAIAVFSVCELIKKD